MSSALSGDESLSIAVVGFDENGRARIAVDGPAGEYLVESSESLGSEENWSDLFRGDSDGALPEIVDTGSAINPMKFYRVRLIPAVDGFHLVGEFAEGIELSVDYSDLQSAFGMSFSQEDAVLPAVGNLWRAARNARVYAAAIAGLSNIAQDIRDSFDPGSQPTTAQIIAALSEDLASGKLDGRNSSNQLIQIGETGVTLTEYSEQDFIDSVDDIQAQIPGLENVMFAVVEGGSFRTFVPADWSDFSWDSADWQ